jgi:DNA-binding transcriptional MerR regulator
MARRDHLTIGEVLTLLAEEFPDITISKIRFLESQGLIDPERTPSGYRKFATGDVEQLRWSLRQQRDRFLPLKVIKEKLARGEHQLDPGPGSEASPAILADEAVRDGGPALVAGEAGATEVPSVAVPSFDASASPLDSPPSSMSLDGDELASASGLSPEVLRDLIRYGLIEERSLGGSSYFDEGALVMARLAARFAAFGVEPRHLRMYRSAAEREAGVFEQVIVPLEKQRNPAARRQARDTLDELARMSESVHRLMLRLVLRPHIEGS